MTEHIRDNIYTFPIPLPENPLKWLNCYVIKGAPGGRSLLVDTGFRRPECLEALKKGMEELEISPAETDVFLTHLHSDHTGNAPELQKLGSRLFMSRTDKAVLDGANWPERKIRAAAEGVGDDVMTAMFEKNPAVIYAPKNLSPELVDEGDVFSCGGHDFKCIYTPGHTPGHMCLYEQRTGTMLLGDHVLFDITPNITTWSELDDALGTYLDSLRKIMTYNITTALPGHRHVGSVTTAERAQALIEHHAARLAETERIVSENPGLTAYQIAGRMTWRISAKNWEAFPPGQKWFAVGEAVSHLDYLVARGRAVRHEGGKCAVYTKA